MDFTTYTSRLEPFLLMSKSAKGAAAAKLVQDATAAQGVYVFAQLLDLQNSQEYSSSYALLELFAHGTYQDYKGGVNEIINLLVDLEISSIRELEDLIIDAIYQNIVQGKLDQKQQQFEVEFTMGRDLRINQLPALLHELKQWSGRTAGVIDALDKKIEVVNQEEKAAKIAAEQHELQREAMIADIQAKSKKGRPDKENAEDNMEIDDMANSGGGVLSNLLQGNKRNK
ncbi:5450_t:CDS:2 [Acaulospora colombiana]|uniref:5450_t:CDS:1 n=1 Tax=Acaulospora colombiana TaxID=27376 RepID=A0ACA9M9W5_9GLOM|nr:5450_t:CDS:2 [Acaulospora colombiana]